MKPLVSVSLCVIISLEIDSATYNSSRRNDRPRADNIRLAPTLIVSVQLTDSLRYPLETFHNRPKYDGNEVRWLLAIYNHMAVPLPSR